PRRKESEALCHCWSPSWAPSHSPVDSSPNSVAHGGRGLASSAHVEGLSGSRPTTTASCCRMTQACTICLASRHFLESSVIPGGEAAAWPYSRGYPVKHEADAGLFLQLP